MVETRSVVMLKSLASEAGFLGWMSGTMYEAESKAGLTEALPITDINATRSLTAFRRREGILPKPAVKLIEELRLIAAGR